MEVKIYSRLNQEFIDQWASLWSNSPDANYINGPQWFMSALHAFKYKKYKIIALYERHELIAVAPLVKVTKFGLHFYALPPEDFVYGNPFLVDLNNKESVALLTQHLLSLGNIFLDNVTEDLIQTIGNVTKSTDFIPYNTNYSLRPNSGKFPQVRASTKKEFLRRANKILGQITFKMHDGKNIKLLHDIYKIDGDSRKKMRNYNAFADTKYRIFYQNLASRLGSSFIIHLLSINHKRVAYSIGFLVNNIYVGSQMAFDESYARYTPGKVLLVKLIESLSNNRLSLIDMGSGNSELKRKLSNNCQILYKGIISKNTCLRKYMKLLYFFKHHAYNYATKSQYFYAIYRRVKKAVA